MARTFIVILALTVALVALTVYRTHAKQVAQRQQLQALVTALAPFANDVTQASRKIAAGPASDLLDTMATSVRALANIDRPTTDSPRIDRLYSLAKAVGESVQQSSDQAVRALGAARGDDESNKALVAGIQKLVANYQSAAAAFLQDYAAAQQELAAQGK